MRQFDPEDVRLAVVGLGYVGLPLAVAFGRHLDTLGFDVNAARIAALKRGIDATREVTAEELAAARRLAFCDDPAALADRNVFVVAVPTPVDSHKRPDFGPLVAASRTVGGALKPGDVVIYDNRATMHRATPFADTEHRRELRRVTTLDVDEPPPGAAARRRRG